MYQDSLMDIWERIRDHLRKLRGQNRWRGTETHLIPKRQIRLSVENRGAGMPAAEVIIHLSDAEVEVWAEYLPGGKQYYLKHYGHNLEAFVAELVDLCRGPQYLHTNSKTADYRRPKIQEGAAE